MPPTDACEDIVHRRLEEEGLEKIHLPLGTSRSKPRIPIFVSKQLVSKSRVVVVLGEPTQDLGILAGRVVNGPGGIDKGSMVSVVRALQDQVASSDDSDPPGIILANTGQLYWWPDGARTITVEASYAVKLPSLVHAGKRFIASVNLIPGNENPQDHIRYIFSQVLPRLTKENAMVDIVAIGQSCHEMEKVFDNHDNWESWGRRLNSLLLLGTVFPTETLGNKAFVEFLAQVSPEGCLQRFAANRVQRARGYLVSPRPIDTPLASPVGNPQACIPALGCPCYSSSEPWYTEMILIRALRPVLSYLEQVATTPGTFENPLIVVVERPEEVPEDNWDDLKDDQKPAVSTVDPEVMEDAVKQARRWRKFEETGEVPDSDDEEESL